MSTVRTLEALSEDELGVVATLWKREHRKLVTSFKGTSMLPTISPGEQVLVDCGVEPVVGDVVVFRLSNQVGVHRVVVSTGAWLLTWGDANPVPDEPIEPARVIGTIRAAAAPRSMRRELLLRFLAPSHARIDVVTRRVRLAHRVRAAWRQGPLVFVQKVLRALIRGGAR